MQLHTALTRWLWISHTTRHRMYAITYVLAISISTLLVHTPAGADIQISGPPPAYTLGVFPYFSPSRLEEIYAPAAVDLALKIGHPVGFRTASTFDKFFLQLKAQAYDIALIQPLYYVPAADEFGYLPIARMREPFKALVVVPEKSAIRVPQDLTNKIVATPPSYVPVVHLARKSLRDQGLVPGKNITFEEMKTVDTCLQQTLIGTTQACVAPPFAVNAFQKKSGVKLRVIQETTQLPNLVFVVHKRVLPADRERIKAAILGWGDTQSSKEVLKSINTQGFVAATDADYQPVRAFVQTLTEPWLPSVP